MSPTLPQRLHLYLNQRNNLHLVRIAQDKPSETKFRPWWRKYWQTVVLHGPRDQVGNHWVVGIREPGGLAYRERNQDRDEWVSGPTSAIVRTLMMVLRNDSRRDLSKLRLCIISPGGKEAWSTTADLLLDLWSTFSDHAISRDAQTTFLEA